MPDECKVDVVPMLDVCGWLEVELVLFEAVVVEVGVSTWEGVGDNVKFSDSVGVSVDEVAKL